MSDTVPNLEILKDRTFKTSKLVASVTTDGIDVMQLMQRKLSTIKDEQSIDYEINNDTVAGGLDIKLITKAMDLMAKFEDLKNQNQDIEFIDCFFMYCVEDLAMQTAPEIFDFAQNIIKYIPDTLES